MPLRKLHILAASLLLAVCIMAVQSVPQRVYALSNEPPQSAAPLMGDIDLNAATVEQLATLPQLGEALAVRIVAYRERHHGFDHIEELLLVGGIGETRLALWRPYLHLGIWRETDD